MSDFQFSLEQFLKAHTYSSCLILSDSTLYPIFGSQIFEIVKQFLPTSFFLVPSGEECKSLESAHHCWNAMIERGMDRKSLLINLGGGSITDLGGFVAGTYMRGIDMIHIPTTVLGMVDAAIGGKTGINLPQGKNLIGVFYDPKAIIVSPHFLEKLPEREFLSGISEIIKYGVIWDSTFFSFVKENMDAILSRNASILKYVIGRSQQIKQEIVEKDKYDSGLRSILNWGHTFAHALETVTEYKTYFHGEAVSIGMNCAAQMSYALGYANHSFATEMEAICQQAKLPTKLPNLSITDLVQTMKKDKKTQFGKISLILAKEIGSVEFVKNIDEELITKHMKNYICAYDDEVALVPEAGSGRG